MCDLGKNKKGVEKVGRNTFCLLKSGAKKVWGSFVKGKVLV